MLSSLDRRSDDESRSRSMHFSRERGRPSPFYRRKRAKRDDVTCPICLESADAGTRSSLPECGHWYCLTCILQWATVSNSCPLCKKKFSEIIGRDGDVHRVKAPETKCSDEEATPEDGSDLNYYEENDYRFGDFVVPDSDAILFESDDDSVDDASFSLSDVRELNVDDSDDSSSGEDVEDAPRLRRLRRPASRRLPQGKKRNRSEAV